MVAPVGDGVGGMIAQANAFVREVERQGLVRLFVIDSAQRYRAYHDNRLWSRASGGSRQALVITAKLLTCLRKVDADAVHIRSAGSLGLVRDLVLVLICRLFRKKTHVSFHFGRIPTLAVDHGLEWRLLKRICSLVDCVEVLDRATVATLSEHARCRRIELVSNGIDSRTVDEIAVPLRESARRARRPRIVFVGMVLPGKGVCELVEACAAISNVEFDLEFIGPVGSEMKCRLEMMARKSAGGSWLSFTGPVAHEEALRRMACANILALPSYTEGFPNCVLEAMACGLPVVATQVGALAEILTGDGTECGLLVPPRDVESLRAALARLLIEPQLRERLGSTGRDRCRGRYELSLIAERSYQRWCA